MLGRLNASLKKDPSFLRRHVYTPRTYIELCVRLINLYRHEIRLRWNETMYVLKHNIRKKHMSVMRLVNYTRLSEGDAGVISVHDRDDRLAGSISFETSNGEYIYHTLIAVGGSELHYAAFCQIEDYADENGSIIGLFIEGLCQRNIDIPVISNG